MLVNQCFQYHVLWIQNSTSIIYLISIHIDMDMLVGSLLCRVFNSSVFILMGDSKVGQVELKVRVTKPSS